MTVFKTFLKILRKNLAMIIVYTIILVIFAGLRMNSKENDLSFNAVKPDITIVNKDEEKGITKGLIDYIKDNSNTPVIEDNEDARDDALFYHDTDYIIYIPENFNKDFMEGKIDKLEVKKGISFNSSYAEMVLDRYLNLASSYKDIVKDQDELVEKIKEVTDNKTDIEITTKLDTDSLSSASFFFNFESYSILVCLIFIISLILTTFNSDNIRKRNIISSTSYKKTNRILLLSNLTYALSIWIIYFVLAIIFLGDILWTSNGLMFVANSFVHLITVTSLAFLIGNITNNKNVINGITNVVGIGSSFLCGVFVPMEYLPESVVSMAHVLPTYYYVNSNEIIAKLEVINVDTLKPVITNWLILGGFTIAFLILTNVISNKKRKIA